MITGIKSKFFPSNGISELLIQWIGCARVIYNAKCDEDSYLRTYARKYLPVGTWPEVDKTYSQFKTDLTPWLNGCPSQILRNSATIWHHTYQRFFKGLGGRPKRKTRARGNYIWLTKELFRIRWEESKAYVELGTVAKPIGTISVQFSRKRIPKNNPKSIWIKRTNAGWSIAFSYGDGIEYEVTSNHEHLDYLRSLDEPTLTEMITPVDRGVSRPVQTHLDAPYQFTEKDKRKFQIRDKLVRKFQRQLSRQTKGSKRRGKTLRQIAKHRNKDYNVRDNFWHQTTRKIVDTSEVVVIEDLKLKNMVKRPKAKRNVSTGKWERNGARAKSGLNRAMLGTGLYKFEQYLSYKMQMVNRPLFKVAPNYTSQQCAHCGHIDPNNRKTQSDFECTECNHRDNADHNAALVIRQRAVNLILDSGTELVGTKNNVLRLRSDANSSKTPKAKVEGAVNCLIKKRKSRQGATEARSFRAE